MDKKLHPVKYGMKLLIHSKTPTVASKLSSVSKRPNPPPHHPVYSHSATILVPLMLSPCNSFEDKAHTDETYGGPTPKWVAATWLNVGHQDGSPSEDRQGDMPFW